MDGAEESRDGDPPTSQSAACDTNAVWQRWTATFRASCRMKNDLITEDHIPATVERHMTLTSNKKRSLFDDDSDSDDEGNYYKLDVPPPQRCHPFEFTPSGYLPTLGPQQVTPCDPDGLPTCTLRRYGYDDEVDYYEEDRIPPPPSFHRYPSKKRAVGLEKPEPELKHYEATDTSGFSLKSSKGTWCETGTSEDQDNAANGTDTKMSPALEFLAAKNNNPSPAAPEAPPTAQPPNIG